MNLTIDLCRSKMLPSLTATHASRDGEIDFEPLVVTLA